MVNRFVPSRLPRAMLGALVTMAVLALGAQSTHAQSNWIPGTGNWNVSTNWNPNGVPNSLSTDVSITGTSSISSSVTLDNLSPGVQNLSLDQYSTLSISGQSLYVAGPSISNAGQINVGGGGNSANLYADTNGGTVTLSGGGTINLNDPNAYLRGNYGNETLVNTNNSILGQGYIYALGSFQNQSTVNANVSGGTLYIYSVPTTNSGTLQATGGGTLNIYNSTVGNAGGTISTDSSSTVYINDSTINGGNLTNAGGNAIHGINSATLNGVTLTSGSTYSVDAGNSNYLTGDLTNKGIVNIGGGGAASLFADTNNGTINLSGGGTINLNDPNS